MTSFNGLPVFKPDKVEVLLVLRSDVLASDLSRMERNGWDADLSDSEIIMFKRERYE